MNHDHKPERDTDLDRMLDTALAKYAAVEPRAGLEVRILANLRSQPPRSTNRSWWAWSLAAVAVAIVLAVVILRPARPSRPAFAHNPNTIQPDAPLTEKQVGVPARTGATKSRINSRHSPRAAVATRNPKLDQFPAPRPLSEQEMILKRFVQQYPDDAALLAEARTESLRRDLEEKQRLASENKDSE